ncbi:MAG: hypothetical protein ABSC05_28590 [Candidatus Solibacter sp.]|jgi:hypothetical protein
MGERHQPDRERNEILDAQLQIRTALHEIQNQLTAAPIGLPNRNTLRALLSAASHLSQQLGTEASRRQEFRQKVAMILDELEN